MVEIFTTTGQRFKGELIEKLGLITVQWLKIRTVKTKQVIAINTEHIVSINFNEKVKTHTQKST